MDSQEYDKLARQIVTQLEQINQYLAEAGKKRSKLQPGHSNSNSEDIPASILALANEIETVPPVQPAPTDQRPPDTPVEEEIDSFLDAIRSRPSGNRAQRQGSLKRTMPLQQSRFLNENNVSNVTMLGKSCSDISTIASKTIIPKPPPVDVGAMIERLRQAIELQGKIETIVPFEEIDLSEIYQLHRERWLEVGKIYQNISNDLSEFKAQVHSTSGDVSNQPAIIRDELVDCMKRMQSTLNQVCFIKRVENQPDLTTTVCREAFPLSECLESMDEKIRQYHL
ncbi:hypothetical protein AND_005910 [Anopheles darlingi]|uniref:Uncharacterized protein n=1 Tax=Anopheles darlingi TaxID=43151 RepID=W5JDH2_ANODA|nr:uncharacterized protein LOC125958283 [Anopheles darlingi]ETN62392.1 hypothetical protein AND_005910 [Anopheles darlingi]